MVPICETACGTSAAAAAVLSATKLANNGDSQLIPFGIAATVDFDTIEYDVGPAIEPDLVADSLTVTQDGIYRISQTEFWSSDTQISAGVTIAINGVPQTRAATFNELAPTTAAFAHGGGLSVDWQLSAGDVITLIAVIGQDVDDAVLFATLSAHKLK